MITGRRTEQSVEDGRVAERLLKMGTTDGTVLLLNAHIADSTGQEIKLPSDEKGLPNEFARLLFRMSSVLPKPMLDAAINAGFAPSPGARGLVMNASAETLTKPSYSDLRPPLGKAPIEQRTVQMLKPEIFTSRTHKERETISIAKTACTQNPGKPVPEYSPSRTVRRSRFSRDTGHNS